MGSIFFVKTEFFLGWLAVVAVTEVMAQERDLGTAAAKAESRPADKRTEVNAQLGLDAGLLNTTSNSSTARLELRLSPLLLEEPKAAEDVIVKRNLELSGPLVQPFKARKILEAPRRLLHLINPFAPSEHKEALVSAPGVGARGWTAVVGWNPSGSAFADPMTHESTMGLLSLSKASQR